MPISASGPIVAPGTDDVETLEQVFGRDNVRLWADLDNDHDETKIDARIAFAVAAARSDVNSRFGSSFIESFATSEPVIFRVNVMRLAGVMLYEARGVVDTSDEEGRHRLTYHKRQAEKFFKQVLAGSIDVGAETRVAIPFTVSVVDDEISSPTGLES